MRSIQGPTALALCLAVGLAPGRSLGPVFSSDDGDAIIASFPVELTKKLEAISASRQQTENSCGPSTVSALLSSYLDDPVTEAEVRKSMGLSGEQACTLQDVANYLDRRGYAVESGKTKLDRALKSIAKNKTPMIVRLKKNGGHAALLLGKDSKGIVLWDPAKGKVESQPVQVFEKEWSGLGLNALKSR